MLPLALIAPAASSGRVWQPPLSTTSCPRAERASKTPTLPERRTYCIVLAVGGTRARASARAHGAVTREGDMTIDRRSFAKSLSSVVGAALAGLPGRASAQAPAAAAAARAAGRLAPAKVTRIRLFYPQNYDRNGPQAFPQSNMVVLVDTEAGITGVGQGGSPDTVRNVARSVIGRNAFDTEMIWQARVHGRLLLAGQGAAARARRHRSRAVGHQGQSARRAALPAVRRQGARTHRAVRDLRSAAGPRAAGRSGAR